MFKHIRAGRGCIPAYAAVRSRSKPFHKKTRKREFLEQMQQVVPWKVPVALIAPYTPEVRKRRPPFATHSLQGSRPSAPNIGHARELEQVKPKIRAKVEHPFRAIKRQFGYVKVRYRGLICPGTTTLDIELCRGSLRTMKLTFHGLDSSSWLSVFALFLQGLER